MTSKNSAVAAVIVLCLVVAAAAGYLLSTQGGPSSTTGGSTTSIIKVAGGNETVIATYVQSLTMTSVSETSVTTGAFITTTTTASTSATTTAQGVLGGQFTYSPGSPLKVTSVSAVVSQGAGGNRTIGFSVTFQNDGNSTIYILTGGGSGLQAHVPANSPNIQVLQDKFRCEIAIANFPVAPGESHTSIDPGCWSGYSYVLLEPGTVNVQFTLNWSTSVSGPTSGSSQIDAVFQLS